MCGHLFLGNDEHEGVFIRGAFAVAALNFDGSKAYGFQEGGDFALGVPAEVDFALFELEEVFFIPEFKTSSCHDDLFDGVVGCAMASRAPGS